jgi:transposase-like protein
MKSIIRDLISQINTHHSKKIQEKIEFADCPLKTMMCEVHLTSIFISLLETEKYRIEKKYDKSVETLKNAFDKTTELLNNPCTTCTYHYRSNIIETMENIINELNKTSNGIFRKKIQHLTHIRALEILKEMTNLVVSNKHQLTESKGKFLGNYMN